MKIARIECFPLKIRPKDAYLGGASGGNLPDYYYRPEYRCVYSRKMETCLVKITTDDGVYGWGEALSPVVPGIVATIVTELFTPLLVGQNPQSHNLLWSKMYDSMRDRGHTTSFMLDAVAAVDTALWDIKAKAAGVPLAELLGGPYRTAIPAYVSGLPKPTPEERIELALSWKEKGFTAIKGAFGYGVREDIDNLSGLRDALGSGFELYLDAHWNYSVAEAVRLSHALEAVGIGFLEAPLSPEDVAGHTELRQKTRIPVALGEADRTRFQFQRFFDARAVDIVQPDVGRVGVTETMRIGYQAETHNLHIAPHLSVGLGPCIAASIHVAAALPNTFKLEYQPPVFELANSLLQKPLICSKGVFQVPEGPGLGIEIDEEVLPHHKD